MERLMTLNLHDREVNNVFSLLGDSENAITSSIAWTLSQCPVLLDDLCKKLALARPPLNIRVAAQSFGSDRGFTDIEIYETGAIHIIVEAKRGWWLPDQRQFKRYMPRFRESRTPYGKCLLVSMSEASQAFAKLHLPTKIDGIAVRHLSWRDILLIIKISRHRSRSLDEKRWLNQLSMFLEGIASMQNQRSNNVYVVSLGVGEISPGSGYTWIDVVEKHQKYFHPVGHGWPAEPPNYIAFRHHGELKSVHHIRKYKVVSNPRDANPKWADNPIPHFVYDLGRPIRPQKPIRSGPIRNTRRWCLIDTLLSGEYETISEASNASRQRLAEDQ